MSYARFSYADVYVYASVYGPLTCCGCALGGPWDFWTTAEMLAHLDAHRAAGHDVPEDCIEGLKEDAAENDVRAANIQAGMCSGCDGTGECRDYAPHNVKGFCSLCDGTKKCGQCEGAGGSREWVAHRPGKRG